MSNFQSFRMLEKLSHALPQQIENPQPVIFPEAGYPTTSNHHGPVYGGSAVGLFREHWQNSGQDVLLDVLRSNQWVSVSVEERETQGRRILAEGLDRIYEDWLSSRSSVTTKSQSAAVLPAVLRGLAAHGHHIQRLSRHLL